MPAAIAVPAIASVVAGGIAAYSAHNAQKSQEKSTNAALDYQKSQDALKKQEYDQRVAEYKQAQAQYMQNRAAILSRYGIHVPAGAPSGSMSLGTMAGRPTASAPPPNLAPMGLSGQQTPPPQAMAQAGAADMAPGQGQGPWDWSNWRNSNAAVS